MFGFLTRHPVRHSNITGYIPEQPTLPIELHPGIPSGHGLWRGQHAPQTMTEMRNIGGVPFRANIRRGVRTTTPEPITPPNFAYLRSQIIKSAKQGVNTILLINTMQRPIGRTPQGYEYPVIENQSLLDSIRNNNSLGH